MIFTEIILHNFGVYKGRHCIDLKPKSAQKPIILFGGLNGGGKTTFLDALQLTLYGKFAECSNRGELSYNDYLKESINRHTKPEEGAALELEFIHFNSGDETTYRIKRFWKSTGKGVKENIEVIKDGLLDPVMSKQWYEYVDEFIPSNISGLFFFDGEKIENLANPEKSAEIIQTGIMSLLGLDLVDKLHNDLRTIERRRLAQQIDSKALKALTLLEADLKQFQKKAKQHKEKLANKSSTIDSLKRQIDNAKRAYKKHGGELYEQRELIDKHHQHNEQGLKSICDNIRKFAEGPAPLGLVKKLLQRAQKQSKKENMALANRDVIFTLIERDLAIIRQFSDQAINSKATKLLKQLLLKDRNQRNQIAEQATPLNVQEEILSSFDKSFFTKLKKEATLLKHSYEQINADLAINDKQLSTIPEADMIKDVAQQLRVAEDNQKVAQGELNILQDTYDESVNTLTNKQNDLDRLLHSANNEQLSTHHGKRILEHITEVQQTLALYRKALIAKHIGKLEVLIKESFIALVRKSDLVNRVHIDPTDFSLQVISQQGEAIPAKRLSAGERQLLAISILWGLAKASGRPLPVIIDTPLGRLDSEHRGHLIDNYFPNASHQVILLSTDTEIDYESRNNLSKSIGKEYHIQYQEKKRSSTITPGYF